MQEQGVSFLNTTKTNSDENQYNAFLAVNIIGCNVHFAIYDSATCIGVLGNGAVHDSLLYH